MKLDTALYGLKNDSLNFLRNNVLSIAGNARSSPGRFYFGYRDLFRPVAGINESFKFSSNPLTVLSATAGSDGKSVTSVQVHNVRMIPRNEPVVITDIEPYELDGTGPDLMVTGLLTACAFVVRQTPNSLIVAHIQPGGDRLRGSMLWRALSLEGQFRGHGRVTHVFGFGRDYTNAAIVIGVRTGAAWHLYGQLLALPDGPITGSVRIV